jgi:hypothetical protein
MAIVKKQRERVAALGEQIAGLKAENEALRKRLAESGIRGD